MDYTITIGEDELEVLENILDSDVSSSRTELHHTDDREYREELRHRFETVQALLAKVRKAHAPA